MPTMARRHVIVFVMNLFLGLGFTGLIGWAFKLQWLPDVFNQVLSTGFFDALFWMVVMWAALFQALRLVYEIVIGLRANRSRG